MARVGTVLTGLSPTWHLNVMLMKKVDLLANELMLYLIIESHFVDNCLGQQSKAGSVVKSDTKGQVDGNMQILHVWKWTLRKVPPSSSHLPQLTAKTKQILSFTLHVQPAAVVIIHRDLHKQGGGGAPFQVNQTGWSRTEAVRHPHESWTISDIYVLETQQILSFS